MTNIIAFLNARLDEDERLAEEALDDEEIVYRPRDDSGPTLARVRLANHFEPGRVIVEVAAKRLVMARHCVTAAKRDYPDLNACEGCGSAGYGYGYRTSDINQCLELRDLACAYCEHPEFDVAWAI